MPNVFNWQIGREMDYPYEPSRPKRQFAMIMDLNKCIACQTCTVACKTNWTPGRGQEYMFWNNVESKPYGFYPLGWDVRILEKHGVQDLSGDVYKGKTLFEAAPEGERVLGYLPDDIDYANPNVGEDDSLGEMPQGD
jgi:nitrate reductase beta subunit